MSVTINPDYDFLMSVVVNPREGKLLKKRIDNDDEISTGNSGQSPNAITIESLPLR